MKTLIIIAMLAVAAVGCKENGEMRIVKENGEMRIVKNYDGTYTVESWRTYPHWQGVGHGNKGTLEQARCLKMILEGKVTVIDETQEKGCAE